MKSSLVDRQLDNYLEGSDGRPKNGVIVDGSALPLGAATESTLQSVLNAVDGLEGFTDGVEGLISASNILLTTIRDNADSLESFTNDIEPLLATANILLTTIRDNADSLEGYTDQLESYVDGLEALITSVNTKLDLANATLSSVDLKVSTSAKQDLQITQATSSNTKLDTLIAKDFSTSAKQDAHTTILGDIDAALASIVDQTDNIETSLDTLNTKIDSLTSTLQSESDATQVLLTNEFNETQTALGNLNVTLQNESDETQALLQSEFDASQVLISATNTKLDTVIAKDFSTSAKQDSQITKLTSIETILGVMRDNADTVENLLTSIGNNTDGLEGFVDGLEALSTSTNSLLTTIRDNADQLEDYTDGLETLVGTTNSTLASTNTLLTTIRDNADQLEAYTDQIETLVTATNALLTTIRDNADTVEALQTSTNTKLDTLNTTLQTESDQSQVKQDTGNTSLASIDGKMAKSNSPYPSLATDTLVVRPLPYELPTYSASASAFVPPAAAATDIFTLIGSATKTIRIHRIRVTGSTTSGSAIKTTFNLIKRSTLNTAGTRVVGTAGAHDSTNAAATANPGHYTVNPTALGTLVAVIRSTHIAVTASGISGGVVEWDFETTGQPLVLRGATENIAINLNGGSITGPVMSVSIEWSEV